MRSRLPVVPALVVVLLAVVLTACGDDGTDRAQDPSDSGGEVPTTARSLAWLAAERLGEPDSASADDDLEELGPDTVGAALRYGRTGESDGDLVTVGVTPTADLPTELFDCDAPDDDALDGCEQIADGVLLQWQEEEPEEDPGVVYVVVTKGETTVVVYQSGEVVTGDPREDDLTVSVDDMVELASDPRVDLTTTREAVDRSEDLPYWTGSDG